LGIHAATPGFRKAIIRPDLLGLDWVKGQVLSPRGAIRVEMRREPEMTIDLTLPPGVEAAVLVPLARPEMQVLVNGKVIASSPVENGTRASIQLGNPGHYRVTSR